MDTPNPKPSLTDRIMADIRKLPLPDRAITAGEMIEQLQAIDPDSSLRFCDVYNEERQEGYWRNILGVKYATESNGHKCAEIAVEIRNPEEEVSCA